MPLQRLHWRGIATRRFGFGRVLYIASLDHLKRGKANSHLRHQLGSRLVFVKHEPKEALYRVAVNRSALGAALHPLLRQHSQ